MSKQTQHEKLKDLAQTIVNRWGDDFKPREGDEPDVDISGCDAVDSLANYVELAQDALTTDNPPEPQPKKLRLYVWTGFCPDYTSGLAFAIARSLEDAQKLVTEDYGGTVYDWGDLSIYPINKRRAFCVSGGG